MASVSFGTVELSLASDPLVGESFSCQALSRAPTVNVTDVPNAAGVSRMRVTPGKKRVSKLTISFATDAQRAFLEANQGELLCFRDPRGDKFYGYYASDLSLTLALSRGITAVTLTITEIGFSEVAS